MIKRIKILLIVFAVFVGFTSLDIEAYTITADVRDHYEYIELGEYQQKFIAEVRNGTQDEIDAANKIVNDAKAAGKTVYETQISGNITRWYTVEPVVWRILCDTMHNDEIHKVLLSEYTLVHKQINSTFSASDESELSNWLDSEFSVSIFGEDKIDDLDIEVVLPDFTLASNLTIFPSEDYRKTELTDYAEIVPSDAAGSNPYFYWLNDNYKDPTYNYAVNELGSWTAQNDTWYSGVRPIAVVNLNGKTLEGEGTFSNPYKLVYPTITDVVISSSSTTVLKGSQQQFNATVSGTGDFDDSVIWAIEGENHDDTTIDNTGRLVVSPNETANTIEVKATSKADDTKFTSVSVTLYEGREITYYTNKTSTTTYENQTLTLPIGSKYYVDVEGMETVEYTLSSSLTLPDNYSISSKTFVGWQYEESTRTFTAQFEEDKNNDEIPDIYQKSIEYNIINGTWNNARMQSSNEIVTFYKSGIFSTANDATANLAIPTNPIPNEGYTLGEWDVFIPETQIRFDNQQLVYTYICSINSYDVFFEENGGNQVENQNIDYGGVILEPQIPVKSGYSFIGWYSDQELVNKFDFDTTMPAKDITLYAKYSVQGKPTVTGDESNTQLWVGILGLSIVIDIIVSRKYFLQKK